MQMVRVKGEVSRLRIEIIAARAGVRALRLYFNIGENRFFGTVPAKFSLDEGDILEVVGHRAWNMIELHVVRNLSKDSNVLPAWPLKFVAAGVCAVSAIACGLFTWHVANIGATWLAITYGAVAVAAVCGAVAFAVSGHTLRRATALLRKPVPLMRPWH